MPTRCNRGFYCRSYCLLNMFRASLCPSSGAQEYYTVVAACGISCCGFFQVAGLVWSWGLCVRFAGCWLAFYFDILTTMHGQNHIKLAEIKFHVTKRMKICKMCQLARPQLHLRQRPVCIELDDSDQMLALLRVFTFAMSATMVQQLQFLLYRWSSMY